MTDLTDRIVALEDLCGTCDAVLGPDAPSRLWCSQECAEVWHVDRTEPLVGYEEPWDLPQHADNQREMWSAETSPVEPVDYVGLWQIANRRMPTYDAIDAAFAAAMSWHANRYFADAIRGVGTGAPRGLDPLSHAIRHAENDRRLINRRLREVQFTTTITFDELVGSISLPDRPELEGADLLEGFEFVVPRTPALCADELLLPVMPQVDYEAIQHRLTTPGGRWACGQARREAQP
jgi:hypothetical protein